MTSSKWLEKSHAQEPEYSQINTTEYDKPIDYDHLKYRGKGE
jgi:hypothetical protein